MADTRRAARKDVPRINARIREPEIRVIGSEGEQLGVMASEDALRRAEEVGLDLVEVAPGSRPPVCRIMDYGRYKYEQQKKKKAGKGKSHSATLKEVKLRPRTDDHDLETKLKNVRRFLMDGDKVKVTVMFRGREMVHRQLGHKQLRRVTDMLGKLATIENPARMEGRFLSMILVSNKEGVAEARREMEAAAKAEAEALANEEVAEARPE
ncbi:MAG: translation initiation factor IF-3 [Deltaproteobacteria bacterium]|nr:MAG: translation initiation factor IF-3 [Deltaproteobacteria bacterium]TDJ22030.1 MAG: translation initiation factor IF-3 [Deltaproteobacteria bacterium]